MRYGSTRFFSGSTQCLAHGISPFNSKHKQFLQTNFKKLYINHVYTIGGFTRESPGQVTHTGVTRAGDTHGSHPGR